MLSAGAARTEGAGGPAPSPQQAGEGIIKVDASRVQHRITPRMIGANIEDLNYQCYGGIYSQLLYGENFQEHIDSGILGLNDKDRLAIFVEEADDGPLQLWGWSGRGWDHRIARQILRLPDREGAPVALAELADAGLRGQLERANAEQQISRHWRAVRSGSSRGAFGFERRNPFNGRQSQRITFVSGEGEVGIDNAGLNRWGIRLIEGREYEGLLRLMVEKDCTVHLSLRSSGGRVLAETPLHLKASPGVYQRLEFRLTPAGSDEQGRFAVTLREPGTIVAGYAFLQPGEWGRFKGLPLRKDLVEAVIQQGVKVMRYNGSMVNRCPEGGLYKWKEMIGPRDLRKPYEGKFNPYATHGFAIFDFLNLCEAAAILPIPGIRIDETEGDMADFVEYVNGAADTPWGRRRAANGHPAPYGLGHIQIGNEESLDENYVERFTSLGEAIWSRDPGITLLVSHNLAGRASDWIIGPNGKAGDRLQLAARIIQFGKDRGGSIWWDCHYPGRDLRDPDDPAGRIAAMMHLSESIRLLVPGYEMKLSPLEENGGSYKVQRALVHAHNQNTLARLGADITAAAAANTLQAYRQDLVWDQGKTFFTASRIWFQPPYYVDQMISQNWAPLVVETGCVSPGDALDALALKSEDGRTLILRVVNLEPVPLRTRMHLSGFVPSRPVAAVISIAGDLADENTPEEPEKVAPATIEWRHGAKAGGALRYTFPPHSFTIIRLQ